MKRNKPLQITIVALLISGCAVQESILSSISAEHPAHAEADEAKTPPSSTTLAISLAQIPKEEKDLAPKKDSAHHHGGHHGH